MGKNKLRPVIIVIEALSSDQLGDIEPFIRNAIAESDDGAMVINQISVQVVQPQPVLRKKPS